MRAPVILFCVSLVAFLAWFAAEGREFYVAGLGADDVRMWAVFVAVGALFCAYLAIPVSASRRGMPDALPVPILAMVLLVPLGAVSDLGALVLRGRYTVIEGDTHDRFLVAREGGFLLAGFVKIYEADGIWLTEIGDIGTDDAYAPISAGEYRLRADLDAVVIETPFSYDQPITQQLVLPDSGPAHPWVDYSECIPGKCVDP